jgi:hypothetical protein
MATNQKQCSRPNCSRFLRKPVGRGRPPHACRKCHVPVAERKVIAAQKREAKAMVRALTSITTG